MKEIIKIIITILITPVVMIGLICIIIYTLHESIWRNKKGEVDIE
jgi:phosphate/sulfate permease